MAVFREDPYSGLNFQVVIAGVFDDGRAIRGSFTEVSGLEVEVTPIEYRNGSEDMTVRKVPGLKRFSNITLRRGVIGDLAFWAWIKSVLDGTVLRANGTITLLDESRQPVMTWKFRRAWPCKWTGPSLDATRNEVAIESIELCHEGLEIE
jgi:phage tail-like protein